MKKLILAFACSAALAAATIADASRPVVQRSVGTYVQGTIDSADGSGCVQTHIDLGATTNVARSGRTQISVDETLTISFSKYDTCTQTALFSGFLSRPLAPGELTSGKRRSLRTVAVVPDDLTPESVTLTIDLAWSSTGELLYRSRSHSYWRDTTVTIVGGFSEAFVADMTGTVSDGYATYVGGANASLGDFRDSLLIKTVGHAPSLADMLAGRDAASTGTPSTPRRSLSSLLRVDSSYATSVWESWDETGCIRTLGVILAEERSEQTETRVDTHDLYVAVSQWGHCANQPLVWIEADYPFPQFEPGAFALAAHNEGAQVHSRIQATDRVSGLPVELQVDVVWTGDGPVAHGRDRSRTINPEQTAVSRSEQVFRSATVSASVRNGSTDYFDGSIVGQEDFLAAGFGRLKAVQVVRNR